MDADRSPALSQLELSQLPRRLSLALSGSGTRRTRAPPVTRSPISRDLASTVDDTGVARGQTSSRTTHGLREIACKSF